MIQAQGDRATSHCNFISNPSYLNQHSPRLDAIPVFGPCTERENMYTPATGRFGGSERPKVIWLDIGSSFVARRPARAVATLLLAG